MNRRMCIALWLLMYKSPKTGQLQMCECHARQIHWN